MSQNPSALPDFARWPSFPFEGDMRVKKLDEPVAAEPPRKGENGEDCIACGAPDEAYIWVSERWRVRAMDRPTGLPMVLILETRSHLDLGDLPNLLAAELGVMTVRLERAVRSLDGVARVHVNRWGDGSAHMHLWFLARPYGQLQLRGTFLSLWDDILPPISEFQWRENLALVAAWLAEFGGRPLAEPPHIQWMTPSNLADQATAEAALLALVEPAQASTEPPASTAAGSAPEQAAASPPAQHAIETPATSVPAKSVPAAGQPVPATGQPVPATSGPATPATGTPATAKPGATPAAAMTSTPAVAADPTGASTAHNQVPTSRLAPNSSATPADR